MCIIYTGDPLDENVILQLLEPAPPLALAKDFMIKTRRRKGLNEYVTINKYIDDEYLLKCIHNSHKGVEEEEEVEVEME